jgi:hypothetical protein
MSLISECWQENGVAQSCLGFHGDAGMFEEGAQLEADIVCFLYMKANIRQLSKIRHATGKNLFFPEASSGNFTRASLWSRRATELAQCQLVRVTSQICDPHHVLFAVLLCDKKCFMWLFFVIFLMH